MRRKREACDDSRKGLPPALPGKKGFKANAAILKKLGAMWSSASEEEKAKWDEEAGM